ncbi:hypothetical protein UC8_44460 [Roseimaritima ulvae]|uniref:Uncharacterized protein n=1 Tax=Roseimaritima ulvae TaxID=980254 RepID=A0A5B9R701_9BACT|nr:hypothetical protein UC8_44460 [Roseimaritima ulvae]
MTKIFLPKFRPGTVTAHQPSDRQRRQEPRGEEGRNIQGKKKTADFHRAPVFMPKIFLPKFRPGTVTAHQPSDRQRRQEPRGEEGRNIQGKKKTTDFHRAPSS